MEAPKVIRIDPKNIDDEMKGTVICSLVEKGWTIQTSIIMEDETKPDYDKLRLGLIMFPPQPAITVTADVGGDLWVRVGVASAAVLAALSVTAVLLIVAGVIGG